MPDDPLFYVNDPELSKRLAEDQQIKAMVLRSQKIRIAAGLALLVVLAAILLMSIFR